MQEAFLAALDALHANPHIGSDAVYSGAGGAVAVRVALSAPEIPQAVSDTGVIDADAMATLAISAVPTRPRSGDTLTIAGVAWVIVGCEPDAERVTWMLALRRPAPTTAGGTALAGAVPA